jgi:hypothetical protein
LLIPEWIRDRSDSENPMVAALGIWLREKLSETQSNGRLKAKGAADGICRNQWKHRFAGSETA